MMFKTSIYDRLQKVRPAEPQVARYHVLQTQHVNFLNSSEHGVYEVSL